MWINREMSVVNLDKKGFEFRPLINAVTIIAAMLIIGIGFVAYTYNTLVNEAKTYITEISELSASNVAKKLAANTYSQESFAAYIADKNNSSNDKAIIDMLTDELSLSGNDMMRVAYVDGEGRGYTVRDKGVVSRIYIKDKDYFKRAINGNVLITDTMIDIVTRRPVNIYAMPVFKNNIIIGAHMGVCLASGLESVLNVDYFDGQGHSYIINSNVKRVIDSHYSDEEDYQPFADINANMPMLQQIRIAIGDTPSGGSLMVNNGNNVSYWISYSPLGISDWYLMLAVPYSYVVKNAHSVLLISLVVLVLALVGAIAVVKYLDWLKRSNRQELHRHVYYDELTGLYSKNGFMLKAPEVLENDKFRYAVVFIDIDNFRKINELFGYGAGTNVLKHMGVLLRDGIVDGELAARTSGDDFICLIRCKSDDEIKRRVDDFIEILNKCKFDEENTNYNIVTFFGIYKLPRSPQTADLESYIDKAKISLLGITDKRTSCLAFYDEELQRQMRFEAELENDVADALKNNDFKVFIQPKYDAHTRTLAGGEALIRWQHKTKGFLTPNKFVGLFERTGVITDIDMYVYDKVCAMQRKWIDEGYTPVPISVNQSRLHLYHSDYIDTLKSILEKYKLPAKYVELEITENIALSSGEVLEQAVKLIHQIGFKVSMDDFGSGESSLNILKDIDIDVLKLDRMFFLETENNTKARQIIKSVIDMASRLHISTVAEGVENEDQLKFLQDAGCDLIQGYLFGKPMPYDEFEELFKSEMDKKKGA